MNKQEQGHWLDSCFPFRSHIPSNLSAAAEMRKKYPVYLNVTLSDKDRWLNALLTRLGISATSACLFLVKRGWTIRRDDRYRSCCTNRASLTWNVICSSASLREKKPHLWASEQLCSGETFKVLIATCSSCRTLVVCIMEGVRNERGQRGWGHRPAFTAKWSSQMFLPR